MTTPETKTERTCENCKHYEEPTGDEPCGTCLATNIWIDGDPKIEGCDTYFTPITNDND